MNITIPAETIPIKAEADICVIGGSCTGVFAAVRAARLGKQVVLLEQSGKFGGVATLDLVGMWHSIHDFTDTRQIIGGLTFEMLERLEKVNAVADFRNASVTRNKGIPFNTDELALELDALVTAEKNIKVYFHTSYMSPVMSADGRKIEAVTALNKSGRFAIRAKFYVDASGDGLLCRDAGSEMWTSPLPQPPTACCRIENYDKLGWFDLKAKIEANRAEFPDLPCGYAWGMFTPGSRTFMLAGTRVLNCRCEEADEVTRAELESRRQIRAMLLMLKKEFPEVNLSLQGVPSAIGIREGLHIRSTGQANGQALLHQTVPVEETIGCATYPVDIHHTDDDRIEFFRLDGVHIVYRSSTVETQDRWLPEGEILPFYRIPMTALIPEKPENVFAAGRMIDADRMAFGALRVMVNLNQCGEAAGVAAALCADAGLPAQKVNTKQVR